MDNSCLLKCGDLNTDWFAVDIDGKIIPRQFPAGALANPAREDSIATAGQTVTTLTDTPSVDYHTLVYLNGLLQTDPTDYSISGVTITWVTPLALNDAVSVVYYA